MARFIEENDLMHPSRLYLVAVSGGADSVALLMALLRLGYRVEVAHCNFNLRGDESRRDEQFVRDLCDKHGIAFHITHFDTRFYAEQHHVSIEMAARTLRYTWFEQLRRDTGAEAVCVAHHSDDSAETVLMNLVRGTGLHGLTGIRPRHGNIVRPLLCVGRRDILKWLADEGQAYVNDSTNAHDDFVRNHIRLNVMPMLEQKTRGAAKGILASARRVAQAALVYDRAIEDALRRLKTGDSIDVEALLREPSPESVVFEWLSPLGFAPATIEDICCRLSSSGRTWASATHEATTHRGRIIVQRRRGPMPTLAMPCPGLYVYDENVRFRITLSDPCPPSREARCATLDADRVVFPLTVRPAATADRFVPFGMKGSRLVSDFLTDRHLSVFDKRRTLVVVDATGTIVWVVGHRPDGRFCLAADTRRVLTIECLC